VLLDADIQFVKLLGKVHTFVQWVKFPPKLHPESRVWFQLVVFLCVRTRRTHCFAHVMLAFHLQHVGLGCQAFSS